ncbi:MAG TPA: hypothetical protein VK524_22795 [Polyangiaceae bacterium]|nr:hypothetical protein [Polyangiaceae bacterium]
MSAETHMDAAAARRLGLGNWLRALGAASFAGAGASFLIEGWTDPGVLKRQLLWALGTLIMSVCGIVAIRRFRDATSARVFLGLAAATIPAHFAQVGASLWALRSEGSGSLGEVLAAGAILLLLAPPLALGISALVRRRARLLVSLVFLTGCPLLLPTRNGDAIALLGVLELLLCLSMEALIFRRDALFRTLEGVCARVLVFLPCAILLVRNAFYPTTSWWLSALVGVPSAALLVVPRIWSQTRRVFGAAQLAGTLGLAAALVIVVSHAPALGLLLSAVALLASETVAGRPIALAWGAAGLLAAAAVASFIYPSVWALALATPIVGLHALCAFRRRALNLTLAVSGISFATLLGHAVQLVHLPTRQVWIPALALSVGLLALATFVEQRRERIERGFSRLQSHFAGKE